MFTLKEVISFTSCEEMASAMITIKEEMHSDETNEVNVCAPDNSIDTILINASETIPYPFKEKGQESINYSETPFHAVGIKMEKFDDYVSEASFANSETKYFCEQYPSNHGGECNVDDECVVEKSPTKLRNISCIEIKMESQEICESCKSDDDMSMMIGMNDKCDSWSVVRGCDMGHSSNEFIRGIECQEYPILRVKEEKEETTDKSIAVNKRNSVEIEKREKREDLTCFSAADMEDNIEEYPYNSEYRNKEGNIKERNNIPSKTTMKIESKEEIGVCALNCLVTGNIGNLCVTETLESYQDPLAYEMKDSCNELPQPIKTEVTVAPERNVDEINPNMTFGEILINNHSKEGSVERTKDLEIQFESICDVSEFDIKAEKPNVNPENIDELDKKSPILEQLCVILKDEPVELHGMGDNLVMRNCFHVANSRRVMTNETSVVLDRVTLQGVYPSHQTKIGRGASAFSAAQESSTTRMKYVEREEGRSAPAGGDEKRFKHPHRHSVFISQTRSDLPHLPRNHKESHTNPKSHTCDICKKTFHLNTDLQTHMRTHSGKKTFYCSICEASFCRKYRLKIHLRTHTGEKAFSCNFCKASFFENSKLTRHLRIHSGERPFTCGLCHASFNVQSSLKGHMRVHTGEKPFTCAICEASFSYKSNLTSHIRIHTGEKPFVCIICDKSFAQKSALENHTLVHAGEKPFSCEICEVSFRQNSKLKTHMRTHTGEKPFTCGYCDVSFITKGVLKQHIQIHIGERPYSCGSCEASFPNNCKLQDHMRTHTGEKPFTCDICEATFSYKGGLKRHLRRTHM